MFWRVGDHSLVAVRVPRTGNDHPAFVPLPFMTRKANALIWTKKVQCSGSHWTEGGI